MDPDPMSEVNLRSILSAYRCPLIISVLCLVLTLLPQDLTPLFQYERSLILQGEGWRLISGHLVHLGWNHLLMNLLGFWLIWHLFLSKENALAYCLYRLPLLTIGTSLGLLMLSPEVAWYRGLSGVLHGLLSLALLHQLKQQAGMSSLLLILLSAKLIWEQTSGPLPGSEPWIDGRVIVDAHLYGALCGVILWLLERSYTFLTHREVAG